MYKYIYTHTLAFLCSFWCIDIKYRDLSLVVCLKLAWLYLTLFSCRLFTKISHSLKLKMQLNVLTLAFKSLAIAHPAREACRKCYSQGFCRVTGFWTCNVPSGISVTMATMQLLMPLTTMTLFLVLYSLTGIAPNTWCIFSHLIFQPLYEQSVIIVPIFQKRKPRLRGVCWLAQGQKISQRKGRKG